MPEEDCAKDHPELIAARDRMGREANRLVDLLSPHFGVVAVQLSKLFPYAKEDGSAGLSLVGATGFAVTRECVPGLRTEADALEIVVKHMRKLADQAEAEGVSLAGDAYMSETMERVE